MKQLLLEKGNPHEKKKWWQRQMLLISWMVAIVLTASPLTGFAQPCSTKSYPLIIRAMINGSLQCGGSLLEKNQHLDYLNGNNSGIKVAKWQPFISFAPLTGRLVSRLLW
ncbi:hypothetical protein MUG84_18725 [Paenibacillus sp. KQZ6P-2]|uniref:Uncharacterized protein n=1 Tax=Paenibacillus mangrovi TaxID=2931978 RepID=A0A9X1WRJ4_9BACL|nr:hypothetical protein [Paenibacillus mangrovi]MCJ8013764.1 hypothetical protein [Paenibacillus mangrovi]